jgi:branched-chain amino acid transport system permease protein
MSAATLALPRSGTGSTGRLVRYGALMGVISIYLCITGIVPVFNTRPLVAGILSLGQAALYATFLAAGYLAATRLSARGPLQGIAAAGAAGGIAGLFPAALVLLGSAFDLRGAGLRQLSPEFYAMVTLDAGFAGFWVPAVLGVVLGAVAGGLAFLPAGLRVPLGRALGILMLFGLFAGVLRTPMLANAFEPIARFLFAPEGLTLIGAALIFGSTFAIAVLSRRSVVRRRIAAVPPSTRKSLRLPAIAFLVVLVLMIPLALGSFFAQVIAIVALYILMGFGLNITLGMAGLLDLGFVAFFAVGAYTVGLMTSTGEFGLLGWSWWMAAPFAVLFAMMFGAFLGLPILGIRGDYLAIATLGFGEIIRILAGSDLLKPWLGGPQGILNIPKPIEVASTSFLAGPNQIYYIALACAVIVAFVSIRLRGSRLGRAWMAIREDEDVAEALGVNLVQTKLLAYMLGGAFAGLGGAVFAGLVGSIFGSSIQLFVSINVAALIIVGGMGSIPGVVLGAIFLIGLPELFREFQDYRFLFYGVALIAMMQLKPEGLLPSRITRRELHEPDELETIVTDAIVSEAPAS